MALIVASCAAMENYPVSPAENVLTACRTLYREIDASIERAGVHDRRPIFHRATVRANTMKRALCGAVLCMPLLSLAADGRIDIARFSQGDLGGWQPKVFSGETRYALASSNRGLVLRADSRAAASGLYRKVSVDLGKTPVLNWIWKVDNVLAGADERTRAGDDYPARVYVVFSGGLSFWRTRAINYVWSNRQPVGSSWPNAFTGNVRMIAVESGSGRVGEWVSERRDVRADYRRLFGEEPGKVDVVAIMTDTDNTGAAASAWYGDMGFSAE